MPKDYHELPKLRDSISYIYVEHCIIEQDDQSIVIIQKDGRVPVPVASLTVLFVGPGTSVTHAAIKAASDNGCMIIWCGERGSKFYCVGMGETRSAANLLNQAKLCMDEELHIKVVHRMYQRRFPDIPTTGMSLQQIRGMEGIRVRQAYALASKNSGVKWAGRDYKQTNWEDADDINRALSLANTYLYGLCHAAIVTLGYSPGLGFVHTGKLLSFVYDVADLYKANTTIPAAFEVVKNGYEDIGKNIRVICRKYFKSQNVLKRIPIDIDWIFNISDNENNINAEGAGNLWDGNDSETQGGINYGFQV